MRPRPIYEITNLGRILPLGRTGPSGRIFYRPLIFWAQEIMQKCIEIFHQ